MPYLELDGRIYLIGSNGAKPRDPFWVENLRANPRAAVVIKRIQRAVHARMVEPDSNERARVWAYARTRTPQYETYSAQTSRVIPVVALE
jgi:deazaflavin-dependent oxidoreductase (nitroreductase family)